MECIEWLTAEVCLLLVRFCFKWLRTKGKEVTLLNLILVPVNTKWTVPVKVFGCVMIWILVFV